MEICVLAKADFWYCANVFLHWILLCVFCTAKHDKWSYLLSMLFGLYDGSQVEWAETDGGDAQEFPMWSTLGWLSVAHCLQIGLIDGLFSCL